MIRRLAKVSRLPACLVVIGAVLILTGCAGPASTSNNNPLDDTQTEDVIANPEPEVDEEDIPDAPKEDKFHVVGEFSGNSNTDTGPFTIKTEDYWRVTVSSKDGKPFTATLYRVGEEPGKSPHHGQVTGSSKETENFAETGEFFWRVESGGLWEILVEDLEYVYAE